MNVCKKEGKDELVKNKDVQPNFLAFIFHPIQEPETEGNTPYCYNNCKVN